MPAWLVVVAKNLGWIAGSIFALYFLIATAFKILAPRATDPRSSPLLQLRGITNDIEERLYEEGIADIENLASANPYRMRRNTRFDKRQILAWIDEALLIEYLPNAWSALQTDGITGTIGLIWYVDYIRVASVEIEDATIVLQRYIDFELPLSKKPDGKSRRQSSQA